MADRATSTSQQHPHASLNPPSSSPHVRHRPLGRAATLADVSNPLNRRRSSLFSDSVSEARNSIRSSTDGILLPKANGSQHLTADHEPSHWHSLPLGLALLPAVGGLLFQNGSAFLTDVTLLLLAGVFLNWSVRLPWEWYCSAQSIQLREPDDPYFNDNNGTILEEDDEDGELVISPNSESPPPLPRRSSRSPPRSSRSPPRTAPIEAAHNELHQHELVALLSCFIFPLIAAWLLHHIRYQLTRPSEGLVSNYNLSIFILAAEIRPMSHLIKMIQARTLYLQRVVTSSPSEHEKIDANKVLDMSQRLEELEAHVAEKSTAAPQPTAEANNSRTVAQVTSEVKKTVTPEIDALNRAVRRYEKRTTIQTIQTESRLHELETRMQDAISLAAAAQRGVQGQRQRYAAILLDWICACVVLPLQALWSLITLPSKLASSAIQYLRSLLGMRTKRDGKGSSRHSGKGRERERERERDGVGKGVNLSGGRGSKKLS